MADPRRDCSELATHAMGGYAGAIVMDALLGGWGVAVGALAIVGWLGCDIWANWLADRRERK